METSTIDTHGHEILDLVHSQPGTFTQASLAAEAQRRWGAQVRFCTCSAGGMTLEELLAFLLGHGKLIVDGAGRLYTDTSRVCEH